MRTENIMAKNFQAFIKCTNHIRESGVSQINRGNSHGLIIHMATVNLKN